MPTEWVLTETVLQSRELRSRGTWPNARCLPLGEAIFRLTCEISARAQLPGCSPGPVGRLSELEVTSLLARMVREQPERFSSFHATFLGGETSSGAFGSTLKSFVDSSRLFLSSERLLRAAVDEHGATLNLRLEELLFLLDSWQAVQREARTFDGIGILEVLIEALHSPSFRNLLTGELLPERVILASVSTLYPLGAEFWMRLSQLVPVVWCISTELKALLERPPSELLPSLRHLSPVVNFLREHGHRLTLEVVHCDERPGRRAFVQSAIDGEAMDLPREFAGIILSEAPNRRDEVWGAVSRIAEGLRRGEWRAEEVCIAALRPERYGELLRRACSAGGVPFFVSCNEPLRGTPGAATLDGMLRWLDHPSLENAVRLWGNELVRPVAVRSSSPRGEGDTAEENGRHTSFSPQQLFAACERAVVNQSLLLEDLSSPALDQIQEALKRFCSHPESGDGFDLSAMVASVDHLRQLVAEVDTLRASRSADQVIDGLLRLYAGLRRPMSRKSRCLLRSSRGTARLESSRQLHRSSRRVRTLISSLRRLLENEPPEALLRSAIGILRSSLSSDILPPEHTDRAVAIVDFMDLGSIDRPAIFLVGCSADNFPLGVNRSLEGGLDAISSAIARIGGREAVLLESYFTLRTVLCRAAELFISFPRETEKGEGVAAQFLRAAEIQPATVERVSECFDDPSFHRSTRLIRERRSNSFTAYDGQIPPPVLAELCDRVYSISSLEVLRDCPHRFLFRHLLRLNVAVPPPEQVAAATGSLVHAVLKEFFSRSPHASIDVLHEIAVGYFERSAFSWEGSFLLRAAKKRILAGLRGEEGRRGFLRLAHDYQRLLLGGAPLATEFAFGGERPVNIPGTDLGLAGSIDRVDRDESGGLVIWDYKTGRPRSIRDLREGRSLQLPLYSLAVKQLFGERSERGGVIWLGLRCSSDQEILAEQETVLVEYLARPEKGRGAAEVVEETLQRAIDTAVDLDRRVCRGELHQVEDTRGCTVCEFRRICYRDELILREKLGEAPRREKPAVLLEADAPAGRDPPLPLAPEQEAACDAPGAAALIAGAGSGKTRVLERRFLRLVLNGEPLSSLVAITFTERAANEIRTRLEDALTAALRSNSFAGNPLTAVERERFREARLFLPIAHIGTIHSFSHTLLRYCLAARGVPSERRLILPQETRALLRQAIAEEVEGGELQADIEEVLESGISPEGMLQILAKIAGDRSLVIRLNRLYGQLNSGERAEEVMGDLLDRTVRAYAGGQAGEVRASLERWLHGTRRWLEDDGAPKLLRDGDEGDYRALLQMVAEVVACEEVDCFLSELRRVEGFVAECYRDRPKRAARGGINPWIKLRDTLGRFVCFRLVADPEGELRRLSCGAALCRLAVQVGRRFELRKREREVFDFDDLILGAHAEIGAGSPQVVTRLRRQFRHFLVDEFQDTDPEQWEIIRGLALSEAGGEERSLLVVGDPQQAIYGFRRGDVRVFLRAIQEIEGEGGGVYRLVNNYRSHPAIIEFVNDLFHPLLDVDFYGDDTPRVSSAVRFQVLRSRRSGGKEARVSLLTLPKGDVSADVAEAEGMVAFIRTFLEDSARDGSYWAPLRNYPSRALVAVLTRTKKGLLATARALHAAGIPFTLPHTDGFFELEEILQFEHLFRVISDPTDVVSLVGLLRSPLVGLSDAELLLLYRSLGQRWEHVYEAAPHCEWRRIVSETVMRWREVSRYSTASQLMESVLEDTQLEFVYRSERYGECYENVLRLLDVLRDAERSGDMDGSIRSAVAWLDLQREEGLVRPNAYGAQSPVVLSTIHGAKGLEFPVVILPFLEWRLGGRADRVRIADVRLADESEGSLAMPIGGEESDEGGSLDLWLKEDIWSRECAESRRLFYVACTRAREFLVLSGVEGWLSGGEEELDPLTLHRSHDPRTWLRNLVRGSGVGPSGFPLEFPAIRYQAGTRQT